MRMSTFRGLATGSLLGLAVGASIMTMPQGRKMRRLLDKGGTAFRKQMMGIWNNR